MVGSKPSLPSWISAASATQRADFDAKNVSAKSDDAMTVTNTIAEHRSSKTSNADVNLGFGARAFSAAGAAVVSAIIVNPLDVVKTRLQAQAAGVPSQDLCHADCFGANTMLPDLRGSEAWTRSAYGTKPACASECNRYKGTFDVFYKVIRQEGFARLWRGTNASLVLAVPTVGIYLPCYDIFRNLMEDFTSQKAPVLTAYVPLVAGSAARTLACISCYPIELARTRMQAFTIQSGGKPPGVWRTMLGAVRPTGNANNCRVLPNYRILWTGLGAQITRDVPFSAICWSTIEPIRGKILGLVGDQATAASVLGANFSAGFIAGCISAAATCPLDVAKTRQQIEKDPSKALQMTTKQTLLDIWRDGGLKGLFTGVGPRVARAGPSVGIVVSFYEVVKYAIHRRQLTDDG